jgi:ADP-heptose:LPS heptosyltransferase
MVKLLIDQGCTVFHFGTAAEPRLSDSDGYKNQTQLSFFDQIKLSLATKVAITTDSGPSWVLSAYSHPCITLLSNWLTGHTRNFQALAPVGDNSIMLFEEGKCNNINRQTVFETIRKFL